MATQFKQFLLWTIIFFLLVAVFFLAFKFVSYLAPYLTPALNLASICPGSGDSGDNLCCTPNCAGKACGDDGCGGICGVCSSNQICNSSKQCILACAPNCSGKVCGSNGCGGSCGTCAAGFICKNGACFQEALPPPSCVPNCAGKACGDDGCGGSCGTCANKPPADTPINTIKKIIETPQGSKVTKTISTAGAVIATAQVAAAVVVSPFNFLLMFLRLSGIFLTALGLKKRVNPWGVVYDSITKQPIDPAYVVLKDLQGKIISSAITDLDGRYGFLANSGVYQMSANKTNYIFPSRKLLGRPNDELYNDLYFGESIEIKQDGDAIIKNIPMDRLKFDWNEFAKKDKRLMKFYSRIDIILGKIFDLFFAVGFVMAIVAYFASPYPYNLIILFIYLTLLFLRLVGIKPKTHGRILNYETGNPLSFALVKVISLETKVEIAHKVSDKYGKYYCLVPKGRYFLKIAKKNDDGSYFPAFVSPVIDASKTGIIKNNFRI